MRNQAFRRVQSNRNYQDPEYIEWRAYIRLRDKKKCQMPLCEEKGSVCHHIQKWANYPVLRYDKRNGIYLCRKHHDNIKGLEEVYASLFLQIVAKNELEFSKRKKNGHFLKRVKSKPKWIKRL